ncbi:MAG TPA: hypothetical protein VNG29_02125 [Candidatus Paceibacterota bacterium]|nr:hypothetical protein [Candidatus Paceibacterota bacterium]
MPTSKFSKRVAKNFEEKRLKFVESCAGEYRADSRIACIVLKRGSWFGIMPPSLAITDRVTRKEYRERSYRLLPLLAAVRFQFLSRKADERLRHVFGLHNAVRTQQA